MGIGADLIVRGQFSGPGVLSPETAFSSEVVFEHLQSRDIEIQQVQTALMEFEGVS